MLQQEQEADVVQILRDSERSRLPLPRCIGVDGRGPPHAVQPGYYLVNPSSLQRTRRNGRGRYGQFPHSRGEDSRLGGHGGRADALARLTRYTFRLIP